MVSRSIPNKAAAPTTNPMMINARSVAPDAPLLIIGFWVTVTISDRLPK